MILKDTSATKLLQVTVKRYCQVIEQDILIIQPPKPRYVLNVGIVDQPLFDILGVDFRVIARFSQYGIYSATIITDSIPWDKRRYYLRDSP